MKGAKIIFITVPPVDIQVEVSILQLPLCELSGSRKALAYPPHINLGKSLELPKEQIGSFIKTLGECLYDQEPFPITVRGFTGSSYEEEGETKYSIHYSVDKTPELLELHKKYNILCPGNQDQPYDPKMILVFDDLDKAGYTSLMDFLDRNIKNSLSMIRWQCTDAGIYVNKGQSWKPVHLYKWK